jgi:hypothetical protein
MRDWRFKLYLSFEMFGSCRVALTVTSGSPRRHRRPWQSCIVALVADAKQIRCGSRDQITVVPSIDPRGPRGQSILTEGPCSMPELFEHPVVFLSIDTPRREPTDIIFVDPTDGSPETFMARNADAK